MLFRSGRAVGTDVDRAALTVAADNAAVNGVSGRLELTERPLERLEERFDFVVANILPADLEQMATGLVRVLAPQGTLWLSGLRSAHVTWMQTTFRRLGLRPLSVRHAEDWRAVELLAGW